MGRHRLGVLCAARRANRGVYLRPGGKRHVGPRENRVMESRLRLDRKIDELYQDVLKMGALVEEAICRAVEALSTADEQLARTVIDGDGAIDALHLRIEDLGTHVVALEQPVASDLRGIITTMRIASDLERIGDHARHIARAVRPMPAQLLDAAIVQIDAMARHGAAMVHDALTAYVDGDVDAARAIALRDDQIDSIHRDLSHRLVAIMQKHPDLVEPALELAFVSRFIERVGDHVTNICEWIVFARTGEHVELNG
ncbi:MAG: phosphate transport system regulatory protein PhoU [Spirochaetaceae bacterium]|nr:MAG: phosphate transport system regulatory protein PhoU [Spirochaetaceae bacterium]